MIEKILHAIEFFSPEEMDEFFGELEKKFEVRISRPCEGCGLHGPHCCAGSRLNDRYQVVLVSTDLKIQTMVCLRQILGLGLKEAKEFVDHLPCTIMNGVSKYQADSIVSKFKDIGKVSIEIEV